jgi:hypothetical protein
MKLVSALVGLATLGTVAFSVAPASAMPAGVLARASQASDVQQASYVCNEWGHCWHRHYDGDGYYHPHYWRWHHWHHRYYDGEGLRYSGSPSYGGWHHWHHHYYGGGWGYGGWHHWHHWHGW